MNVDLGKDKKKIRRYVLKRVEDYQHYLNIGPGEDDAAIRLVTAGYYIEQSGYFSLVFDTRPDAEIDGEWTNYLEDDLTVLGFPQWSALVSAWYSGKQTSIVMPNGKTQKLTPNMSPTVSVAQIFGEVLRDTMLELRDEGHFQSLPLSKKASLSVEEFDGNWYWPPNDSLESGMLCT